MSVKSARREYGREYTGGKLEALLPCPFPTNDSVKLEWPKSSEF